MGCPCNLFRELDPQKVDTRQLFLDTVQQIIDRSHVFIDTSHQKVDRSQVFIELDQQNVDLDHVLKEYLISCYLLLLSSILGRKDGKLCFEVLRKILSIIVAHHVGDFGNIKLAFCQ